MKSRLREVERVAQGYMATQREMWTSSRLSRPLLPRSPPTWSNTVLFIHLWLHWGSVAAHGLSVVVGKRGSLQLWHVGSSLWWLLCDTWAQQLWCMGLVGSPWTRDRAHVTCVGGGSPNHWAAGKPTVLSVLDTLLSALTTGLLCAPWTLFILKHVSLLWFRPVSAWLTTDRITALPCSGLLFPCRSHPRD